MKVNEYQLAVAAERVAALVEPTFFELPEPEQRVQVQQTSAWLLPLLRALPEGTKPETLNQHSSFLFACAEDFLLEVHRNHPGYRTLSDDVIRASLDSEKIQQVAVNLYRFAQAALETLPLEVTLEDMLENISSLDLDAELLRLLNSDS